MNLDDLLRLAAEATPTRWERAQARRDARRIQDGYARAKADGRDLVGDLDLRDPLADDDEAARIARAARTAKLATFTWIAATDDMLWSDELSLLLGRPPGTVRPSPEVLLARIHRDDLVAFRAAASRAWQDRTVEESVHRVVRPDGSVRYVNWYLEVCAGRDGSAGAIVGTAEDVTSRELARRESDRLARRGETVLATLPDRDPDTGLFVRTRFADEVDRASRAGAGALLFIAVDFRAVDSLPAGSSGAPGASGPAGFSGAPGASGAPGVSGAAAGGGRLVESVAALVKSLVRRNDICGHVGSRQIGVLLRNTPMPLAQNVADDVVASLRAQPFVVEGARVRVDAWGGLVPYGSDVDSAALLIDAETAWQRAKERRVPLVVFERPAAFEDRRRAWRANVQTALATGRLTLYAQPILDLALNQVTRHEILLRLLDDTGAPVSAAGFVATAEQVDEVLPIDLWVLERAMELIANGPPTTHFHVNLSGRSVGDSRLPDHVDRLMHRFGVNPAQLTFEITETAAIGNMTEARRFAAYLHGLGCELALDDFGSGHASFGYLKYLPVDVVKIGGEFISGIGDFEADQVMVRAVIQVCRALGIRTVAEFAEDPATVTLLREYGVDFIQGYLVGAPGPLARPVSAPHRVSAPASHQASSARPASSAG